MEIFKNDTKHNKGYTVYCTMDEAYRIIRSLAAQLEAGNPNVGRAEFRDVDDKYFTIAIVDKKLGS